MGIFLSLTTLANPGDNFLFPSPGFPLIVTIGSNQGIAAKFYDLLEDSDWEADLKQMESLIDAKTKSAILPKLFNLAILFDSFDDMFSI